MIALLKTGTYSLIETRSQTKILTLDNNSTYAWIYAEGIGEILVDTHKPHETDHWLAKGVYKLYRVAEEPKITDHLHLELAVGDDQWQGYFLITGFPKDTKTRSRIVPTRELITGVYTGFND